MRFNVPTKDLFTTDSIVVVLFLVLLQGLSAREMEMLKKATAELQGINNGNQPAYSAVEGGYGAAPHQAEDPYYE